MVRILRDGEWVDYGYARIPFDYVKALDESFDNAKIIVDNTINTPLLPSTILELENEHWYVNGDKCVYKASGNVEHTINLEELTQLLNDRFVEDCSFAPKRYTLKEGIERLLLLSNSDDIEIDYNIENGGVIDKNQTMKTFRFQDSNLFNALSQIFKSVGRFPRLLYTGRTKPFKLVFDNIGIKDYVKHNFSEITNIEVTKELSREANSSIVISNCKNIGSDSYVWYPSDTYGKRLYPNDFSVFIDNNNASFVFGSNVRDLKKIRIFPNVNMEIEVKRGSTTIVSSSTSIGATSDNNEIKGFLRTWVLGKITDTTISSSVRGQIQQEISTIINNLDNLYVEIENNSSGTYTTYDSDGYGTSSKFYLYEKKKYDLLSSNYSIFPDIVLNVKDKSLYWEQNGNYIKGFDKDFYKDGNKVATYTNVIADPSAGLTYDVDITIEYDFGLRNIAIAGYILPQTNIRLLTTNDNIENFSIIKQFNQSGKSIDYGATKKELQNYVDNMESKDIIVKGNYNNKEQIYDVGSILIDDLGNEDVVKYIITKESITNYGNGNYEVIYQLNEDYVRRSEYISADSDIRDYDIPISNLVKRTKVFKDKYIFSYVNKPLKDSYSNINMASGIFNYKLADVYEDLLLAGEYNIAFLDCGNGLEFSYPTLIQKTNDYNSCVISINIDDNFLIGQNVNSKYSSASKLEDALTQWDVNRLTNNNNKIYTPIRYTNENGWIEGMTIIFIKSSALSLYDSERFKYGGSSGNYSYSIQKLTYEYMPNATIMPYFDNYRSLYQFIDRSNQILHKIKIPQFVLKKDKYESLNINYEIEYDSDKNIELGRDLINYSALTGVPGRTSKIWLFDKEDYRYITKDTQLGQDYIEITPSNIWCYGQVADGNITFKLPNQIELDKYNIVIVNNEDNRFIMALNDHPFKTTNEFTIYLNTQKY